MVVSSIPIIVAVCVMAVTAIPPLTPKEYFAQRFGLKLETPLNSVDMETNATRAKRAGFKYLYVDHSGNIHSSHGGNYIEVSATYSVSDHAHHTAAVTIGRLTHGMSSYIFSYVASHTKAGVFTKSETLCVFPEFTSVCNPSCNCNCKSSPCYGACSRTCTADGRPYSSLAGTGGQRGVIVEDNVLCNAADGYQHKSNILVHEYAHTIMNYGLPADRKSRITAAYNNARTHGLWTSGYAMSNADEYWAEATATYFNAEHLSSTASSGMNSCSYGVCNSEHDARTRIYNVDRQLYNILTDVYLNNDVNIRGNIGTCTTGTAVGK